MQKTETERFPSFAFGKMPALWRGLAAGLCLYLWVKSFGMR